jgi:hypothetical protein
MILTINFGSAQSLRGSGFVSFSNTSEMQNYGIKEFSPESKIKGSSLLFPNSRVGIVKFKNNSESEEVKLNFDSYNNFVVVESDQKTFAFPIKYVDSILFKDQVLYSQYGTFDVVQISKGEFILGEILVNGNLKLFKSQSTKIKEPTYNSALDTGDRDSKYIHSTKYYIEYNDKVFELPNRRKKVLNDKRFSNKIRMFLKINDFNFKKESDIIAFANSFNANN